MMRKFAIAAVVALLSVSPVLAECYEIGCTDEDRFSKADLREWSCDDLWVARKVLANHPRPVRFTRFRRSGSPVLPMFGVTPVSAVTPP